MTDPYFTDEFMRMLCDATGAAVKRGSEIIEPQHLLLATLEYEGGQLGTLLEEQGARKQDLLEGCRSLLPPEIPRAKAKSLDQSSGTLHITFTTAALVAEEARVPGIRVEHLFLALLLERPELIAAVSPIRLDSKVMIRRLGTLATSEQNPAARAKHPKESWWRRLL